jgi:hypothetical protein
VRYFANPSNQEVLSEMRNGSSGLGAIVTPVQGNRIDGVPAWCADNGCFGKGYPGDVEYLAWLARKNYMAESCAFAAAPDVLGNAGATLKRSAPFLPVIRALGYPAAFVGQDGLENLVVPWDSFDAFFIGGTTEWKLGEAAKALALEAGARGKWVHMGRVNSRKRLRYAESIGCDSVDGTYLIFRAPDQLAQTFEVA